MYTLPFPARAYYGRGEGFDIEEGIETVLSNDFAIKDYELFKTPEFRKLFREAELIISKGQGNYEVLSEVRAPIYFLFKAKCPPVAEWLGVSIGATIFKRGEQDTENAKMTNQIRNPNDE